MSASLVKLMCCKIAGSSFSGSSCHNVRVQWPQSKKKNADMSVIQSLRFRLDGGRWQMPNASLPLSFPLTHWSEFFCFSYTVLE